MDGCASGKAFSQYQLAFRQAHTEVAALALAAGQSFLGRTVFGRDALYVPQFAGRVVHGHQQRAEAIDFGAAWVNAFAHQIGMVSRGWRCLRPQCFGGVAGLLVALCQLGTALGLHGFDAAAVLLALGFGHLGVTLAAPS
jgi:hypothetical protein